MKNMDIKIAHSFADTGLNSFLIKCYKLSNYQEPTPIQYYSIRHAINTNFQQNMICQSKSGTGKTLAYLSICLGKILNNYKQKKKHPSAIIILPTRELAIQVYQITKQILQKVKDTNCQQNEKPSKNILKGLQVQMVIGGIPFEDDQNKYQCQGCDILIGTVGRIYEMISRGVLKLSEVQSLIMDEGDKLFSGQTVHLQTLINFLSSKIQIIIFSATYSRSMLKILHSKIVGSFFIQTLAINNKLVVTQKSLVEVLKDMPQGQISHVDEGNMNEINLENIRKFYMTLDYSKGSIFNVKIEAMKTILKQINFKKCLVFVEKKVFIPQIGQRLQQFDPLLIHGSLSQAMRIKQMNKALQSKIIVSSDLLARGIDFELDLVILFDIKFNETFWHRIGRTGRFGKNGVVISLDCIEDWQKYQEQTINQILNGIELQNTKKYYGKYMSQLGNWHQNQNNIFVDQCNGYKYFIQPQLQKQPNGQPSKKQKHHQECLSADILNLRFQTQEQFLKLLTDIKSCPQCVKLMESITQLTGYHFKLLSYEK